MKTLIVTNLYPPYARSGAETVAILNAKGLLSLEQKVVVLTARPFNGIKSLLPKPEENNGILVYSYYPINICFFSNINKLPKWLRYIWAVIDMFNIYSLFIANRVINKENPNLIISHNLRGLGYLLPSLFVKKADNYIHILHDVQLVEPSGAIYYDKIDATLNVFWKKIYQFFTRLLFRNVKKIISPSNFLLSFYKKNNFFKNANSVVLRNPVTPMQPKIKHSGVNILFVGQLEHQKGIETLLSAWNLIKTEDMTLHLVGSGSLQNKISDDEQVKIYGRLELSELEKIWRITDVLVFPSLILENSPVAITEALAMGIPIVSSDVGGASELVKLSQGSEVITPNDTEALVQALKKVVFNTNSGHEVEPVIVMTPLQYAKEIIKLTDL